ncbi:MFS transporter [Paenibacillus sp. P25]|nr:MFS transporter [Paenibacillus sp. P25]
MVHPVHDYGRTALCTAGFVYKPLLCEFDPGGCIFDVCLFRRACFRSDDGRGGKRTFPGQAGLVLLPGGAAAAVLSPFVGRLSDRFGAKRLIIAGVALMGLSTLFLSAFASGASPVYVSISVLGAGMAFALTNSPANNAAVSVLPEEDVGVGVGIFQGSLYLGAGIGAGMVGALLSARRDAVRAWNPFYTLEAISYSDAFLAATVTLIIALIAAYGLKRDR